jgi:hypothetical protein
MEDFEVTVRGNKKQPEASLSFKSFKILMISGNLLIPLLELFQIVTETNESTMFAHKILTFEFVDFDASAPNLTFADLINPSENKMPPVIPNPNVLPTYNKYAPALVSQRIIQYFMLFLEIKFISFHFEFNFPIHESVIDGFANEMVVTFPNVNSVNPDSIQMKMTVAGGVAEITQSEERALLYSGKFGIMRVEMHMETG